MHINVNRIISIVMVLSCLLLFLAMVAASAQSNGHQPKPNPPHSAEDYFKTLDKNGDGELTAGEWHAESLKAADANADGVVTLDEFRAFVAQHYNKPSNPNPSPEEYFKKLDKNGDGKLTAGEWNEKGLNGADANGDGVVTFEEFRAFATERINKPTKSSNPNPSPEEYFRKLDKNGDGKLTAGEWNEKGLKGADANGDGKLTAGEWNEKGLKGADANGDGVVDFEEFRAFVAERVNKPAESSDPSPSPEEYFQKLDKNGDGNLTAGEWKEKGLKGADANGDGGVTLQEFKAFVAH